MRRIGQMIIAVLILSTALVSGCASIPRQAEFLMVWPGAPEEPRLAYVRSYQGQIDFMKLGILDYMFGVSKVDRLVTPYGVAVYKGKILVSLVRNGKVAVIDPQEQKISYIGVEGTHQLAAPMGIAVSDDGIIYVADTGLRRVIAYDLLGNTKAIIGGKNELVRPVSVAVNNALQRIYVVDTKEHKVRVYSPNGEGLFEFGKRGDAEGDFNYPIGIDIDRKTDNVLIVDSQNHRVQVFDKDGKYRSRFGENGDGPGAFGMPKNIAMDSEGHIYVTDGILNNFQIFSADGQPLMKIDGRGVGPAGFEGPAEIAVDANDSIFIADSSNARIQQYQFLSDKWKQEHPDLYERYKKFPEGATTGEPKK
ncbi:MAG: 6-bladed beta-propeller [Nitrospiraceae bacterium]|nr:6-bladed beta-propeller [Nitrospiraceae bacterium]